MDFKLGLGYEEDLKNAVWKKTFKNLSIISKRTGLRLIHAKFHGWMEGKPKIGPSEVMKELKVL